jgi:serine kinase of HPr protein (carbohydrate metabolism regulator)
VQATLPGRPTVAKQASLPSRWSNTAERAAEQPRQEPIVQSANSDVPKWVSHVRRRVPLVAGSVSIHRFRHTSLYANTPVTKYEVVEFLKRECTDCNLSQRVVVEVLLLGESSIIVMGSAGSGKSHAMAKAMKKAVDTFIFTNKRLILVEKQGITGSKIEYKSIIYKSISRFSVETAGTFDLEAELKIWVSSETNPSIIKQFNKSVNVYDVQNVLAHHVLK